MKHIIVTLATALTSSSSMSQKFPEYFGVYARYKNGDLVQLKETNPSVTQISWGDGSAPKSLYVISEPATVLDLNKMDAFIIYGEKPISNETSIRYFSKSNQLKIGYFFNETIQAADRNVDPNNSWIGTHYICSSADGMQHKKIKDGMYIFKFPVNEETDYKFCDLTIGKILPPQ